MSEQTEFQDGGFLRVALSMAICGVFSAAALILSIIVYWKQSKNIQKVSAQIVKTVEYAKAPVGARNLPLDPLTRLEAKYRQFQSESTIPETTEEEPVESEATKPSEESSSLSRHSMRPKVREDLGDDIYMKLSLNERLPDDLRSQQRNLPPGVPPGKIGKEVSPYNKEYVTIGAAMDSDKIFGEPAENVAQGNFAEPDDPNYVTTGIVKSDPFAEDPKPNDGPEQQQIQANPHDPNYMTLANIDSDKMFEKDTKKE